MKTASKFSSDLDYSMNFEIGMSLLFGDSAYQIAGMAFEEKTVKKWLFKAINRFKKEIVNLDTTTRHKEMLMLEIESVKRELKSNGNLWEIIFHLFRFAGRFLGYDYIKGTKLLSVSYFQNPNQKSWSDRYLGKDWKDWNRKNANAIKTKVAIIQKLKKDGIDTFDLSLVFNTSEYEIKKILRETKT